jgi:Ca2+-binding EF-hand superfamily protein
MGGIAMRKWLFVCLVFTTFLSFSASSFGDEKKNHVCFRSVDADKNGKVTYQEFQEVFGNNKEKFQAIDGNRDGVLSHSEYHKSLGHGASEG